MSVKTVDLHKEYKVGDNIVKAVNGVDLTVEDGKFIAIMGPSGCGKTTLLHLIGGLDKVTSGQVIVNDTDLSKMNDTALSRFRCCEIGFVFQKFNLINEMTVMENIVTPVLISKNKVNEEYVRELTEILGLSERLDHTPLQLSGGQQQRVAIARALANDPGLILCDEPTGNLDKKNSEEVISLLDKVHDKYGKTIIMVTHDPVIAGHADFTYHMEDGKISVL
ncbi:MAG: ABC transporter ATP-binding protein [Saccharofermentans sp.]|nr:ABC transporter ATP-binding protein [Saccharofermentans sp.]